MITHEKVGYVGYVASADTLQKDVTEYSTTETSYVIKVTGTWLSDVQSGSTIRFKCDMKKAGGGASNVVLTIGGVVVKSISENNVAYQSHSYDLNITWARSDQILIKLKSTVAGTAYVKNIEFAGIECPLVFA